MYLRCSRCHESTWIRSLVPGTVERRVDCQDCGHGHDLSRAVELGDSGKKQYEVANAFATTHGVDLPTAYSVLLGLMTLLEARDADVAKKQKQREEAAPPAPIEVGVDESTTMSPPRRRRQTRRRAKRPRSKEGKVSIHVERETARERRHVTPGQIALVLVLAAVATGLAGRHAYRTWSDLVEEGREAEKNTSASAAALENAERRELTEARKNQSAVPDAMRAKLQHDAAGNLTRVVGPNPMSVLYAYCEATAGQFQREPLELAQAAPPSPDERYGIFRDFSRLENNHAIRISQDRETRRWATGDGSGPIRTRVAPTAPKTIRRASLDDRR